MFGAHHLLPPASRKNDRREAVSWQSQKSFDISDRDVAKRSVRYFYVDCMEDNQRLSEISAVFKEKS
jgi:hypothetical protein